MIVRKDKFRYGNQRKNYKGNRNNTNNNTNRNKGI